MVWEKEDGSNRNERSSRVTWLPTMFSFSRLDTSRVYRGYLRPSHTSVEACHDLGFTIISMRAFGVDGSIGFYGIYVLRSQMNLYQASQSLLTSINCIGARERCNKQSNKI